MAPKGLFITPDEVNEILKKRYWNAKNNGAELVEITLKKRDINEFIVECEFDKFCEIFDKIFGGEEILYVKEEDYLDSEDGVCEILEELVSRIKQKLQKVDKEKMLKFLFKLIKELLLKNDIEEWTLNNSIFYHHWHFLFLKMVRTRFTPRRIRPQNINFDERRTAAAKEIANRRRTNSRNIKIKVLLPQSKNVDVKQRGVVVRRMTVRRRSIYPAAVRNRKYG